MSQVGLGLALDHGMDANNNNKFSQIQAVIQFFDKVARHTCTVVFCKLMLFTPVDVKMT